MNRMELLAAARNYASAGWPVFWLGRTKRPVANCAPCRRATTGHDPEICECLTCHGFYAATTDVPRLREMYTAVPSGLLAIRTGAASRLVVVDIDPAHGGTLNRKLMPPTAAVQTGSGGLHLYYRHPGDPVLNSQSRLGTGVDVRGDGGYVVAPPSTHPTTKRRYRWAPGGRGVAEMPPALIAACRPQVVTPPATPSTEPTPTTTAGGISYPQKLLDAHLSAIARAPEGRRRTTLYGAARGVARMVAAGAIDHTHALAVLTDAGRQAGQTEREARTAIEGGFAAEGVAA